MRKTGIFALAALLALSGCGGPGPNNDTLAAQDQLRADAPLQTQQSIIINAPPAKIWAILVNIDAWPGWQPYISQAASDYVVQNGAVFSWTTGGTAMNCVIRRFIPSQSLGWTGSVLNFHVIHLWDLSPLPDGTTEVTERESINGFLVGLFYSNGALARSDALWLQALKKKAES